MLSSVSETRIVSPIPSAKQRADADRAFDPRVFAFAGFGHAEMNRIIPIRAFLAQPRDEQSVRVDHDLRVARFHRKDESVIIEIARDAGELERALDHAERRVAVAIHDAIAERAVVRADAHGDPALLAQPNEWRKSLPDSLQLGRILFVGVFDDLELLRVGVIARD